MKILLIITHSKIAQKAVPWVAETARKRNAELLVANCVLNPVAVPGRVGAWPLIEKPQKVRTALKESIAKLADDNVTLLDEISSITPIKEISNLIKEHGFDIIYFPVNARLSPGAPDMQFGQQLLRNCPCDVVLVDLGQSDRNATKRLIVPMDLAASGHVFRHITKIGSTLGEIVPLHISRDFGGDSQKIAVQELNLQLSEMGLTESVSWIKPQVVMADGFHQGILQTVKANDAIVLGGSSIKLIHDLRIQLLSLRPQIAAASAIGIFRPVDLAAKTGLGRFGRRLKAAIPELTLADRVSLFDRIQGGARLTPDYIAMIGLSVVIASFGLMADNASVVIGAMLVAPFMTPLIGVGLALAQGNLALMKRSALATGAGVLVGVFLSFVLGLCVPLDELPLEILTRGDPDIVDMAIAFVSGMAAAYAVSRESVAESIVGVAIAAALVPPLACVGIMLAQNHIFESEGAIVLLVTNLAAIALGAATVFRRLGVPGTRTGNPSYVKIRWISTSLVVLLLLLAVPLGFQMADRLAVGQIRPMNFRVSSSVKKIVNERVNMIDELDVMLMGRSGSGHSRLIRILLQADEPVPNSMIEYIKDGVQEVVGEDTPVHIAVFQNAIAPRTMPKKDKKTQEWIPEK